MFIGLSSKIASLQVQRRMNDAHNDAGQVFQRLASGQRINRAADDAAGLALSSSLRVNSRVFAQGVRNLNDGISALNIADSAVSSLGGIVERIRELATQASNGSYSSAQRAALDKEAQELRKEYFRLSSSTSFNGISLLNGALGTGLRIQSGYGASGSILTGVGGTLATGTFSTSDRIDVGFATTVSTIDVNGDGKLDLLQGNAAGPGVTVRIGLGDGTFTDGTTYGGLAEDPLQIITADFNNDGRIDLGVRTASSTATLLGNGDGTFQNASVINIERPFGIAFADFNGDGNIDYLEAAERTLKVYSGNGAGGFAATTSQSYSFSFNAERADLKVADLNNDGRKDIFILVDSSVSGGVVEVLSQQQNGSLQAAFRVDIARDGSQIELADLNNDGKLDLAITDAGNGTLDTYINNPANEFSSPTSQIAFEANLAGLKAGDFNGDGNVDLLGFGAGGTNLYIGRGDGNIEERIDIGMPEYDQGTAGDFNGDGALDFIGMFGNRVYVSTNITQEGINPLQEFSLLTLADAKQAVGLLAQTADNLSKQRGQIGSYQSRLEVAARTTQAASDKSYEASSRITDIDVAAEAANLVKNKTRQDVNASLLAQMNLQSDLVLQLLRIS
jgi:flagellin